jgi:hypothetical protein
MTSSASCSTRAAATGPRVGPRITQTTEAAPRPRWLRWATREATEASAGASISSRSNRTRAPARRRRWPIASDTSTAPRGARPARSASSGTARRTASNTAAAGAASPISHGTTTTGPAVEARRASSRPSVEAPAPRAPRMTTTIGPAPGSPAQPWSRSSAPRTGLRDRRDVEELGTRVVRGVRLSDHGHESRCRAPRRPGAPRTPPDRLETRRPTSAPRNRGLRAGR